jgi:septum site-determining protein MinC
LPGHKASESGRDEKAAHDEHGTQNSCGTSCGSTVQTSSMLVSGSPASGPISRGNPSLTMIGCYRGEQSHRFVPTTPPKQSVRFRGRSFMALVLAPETPLAEWFAAIDALLIRTPNFFVARPVVLDLTRVPQQDTDLRSMLGELQARAIRVMAIEGLPQSAVGSGLPPVISGGRAAGVIEVEDGRRDPGPPTSAPKSPEPTAVAKEPRSLLIDAPVRSGQSIMFLDGDVTVVGSVASGAEVIAGGSVHVYGTLRGRAIAGATGNAGARIFCQRLEAELLAIDGLYQTAERIDPQVMSRPVQARLESDSLVITALN